jgi:hypothetical protein
VGDATRSEIEAAQAYFDRFVAAFATFDGRKVAELFAPPVVAVRGDGSSVGLPTQDDVIRYYQAALDEYRGKGCASARWFDLAVTPMGRASLLGAVTWQLLKADGTVLTEGRQSYGLRRIDGGEPKAFACASHSS